MQRVQDAVKLMAVAETQVFGRTFQHSVARDVLRMSLVGSKVWSVGSNDFEFRELCLVFRLHDRKLCVLGLCILIDTPATSRHAAITENARSIVPAALLLFAGLKRAYSSRVEDRDSDEEEDDDDDATEGTCAHARVGDDVE